MNLQDYIDKINKRFKTGISTEHSYRGDLQSLLETISPDVIITNEPKRISCGSPDYIINTKDDIPVSYIEAKDIGKDLGSKEYKEQFDRYKKSLSPLIFTDYLDFWLFEDSEFVMSIKIAEIKNNTIISLPQNFEQFTNLIKDFCIRKGQTIKSASKLAKMMAGKAKMLANIIEKSLMSDEENQEDSTLKDQMNAFKDILIHDITPKEFSDIYAQTIAYGMFAGRLHDKTLETFSRQEAAELIPKSNPFLRKLFQYIAGYDLDTRIVWIVDALADIFRATDVDALLKNFGKTTQQHDPIIHFYETFLSEYDPALRKARGVWYTPEPVVSFIVRAVDDILKTEFGLTQGLADTSKTKIKLKSLASKGKAKEVEIEQEIHNVQILDPATGTGTFLSEVIKQIYKKFEGQQGIWSNYVENHLIPRLNGFELLMASYAMAHLKLDMLLYETGYKPKKQQRFRVYLTNSLEEYHDDTGTIFANWLSQEANEANYIKRDTPVMVVIGNPPYSVSSSNKSDWILNLIKDYKKNLEEKTLNSLSDDYVKFIRYAQYYVEKNTQGIVAMVTNNSFIDGVTFRQMRKNLLETFDKVYIYNLHGSYKKQETSPDDSKDENVFDIQQGVSINIFVKLKTEKQGLGEILYYDSFGKREDKYKRLWDSSLDNINWEKLEVKEPHYFFIPRNNDLENSYSTGFKLSDLFINSNSGIQTKRDELFVSLDKEALHNRITNLLSNSFDDKFKEAYNIYDSSGYKLTQKIEECNFSESYFKTVEYRPFDRRAIYYDIKLLGRPVEKLMSNMLQENIGLITCRQESTFDFQHVFITKYLADMCTISSQTKETGYLFPLYLYSSSSKQESLFEERKPNFHKETINKISKIIMLSFTDEKEDNCNTYSPVDIMDYIYSVLHSPTYREKYKEQLKIDFPRIPYPKDKDIFCHLVKLGSELRQIHLLESSKVKQYITTYPNDGNNIITRSLNKNDWELYDEDNQLGRVWINDDQYFDKVPLVAWEFFIGGYQPAQKWLKDRRQRELTFDDILHYQKIIVALNETDRLMKEIDKIEIS